MAKWLPIAPWRPVAGSGQKVAFTGVSAQSAAVGAQTHAVLLAATSDCHVEFGSNPTATATSCFIKGGTAPIPLAIGPSNKIAVVQDTAAGNLFITELSH